jgi:uncharacterized protein YkwD
MKQNLLSFTLLSLSIFVVLTSFSPARNSNLVADVLVQTNRFRAANSLKKLIINKELNAIAQRHSADMAGAQVDFGHNGFGERSAEAKRAVKGMHNFAENVAYGANSGKEVVGMWETSPGHRRNMLGNYKFIGIGIAKDRQGRNYYTQVFAD